jgi:hypothetical protein
MTVGKGISSLVWRTDENQKNGNLVAEISLQRKEKRIKICSDCLSFFPAFTKILQN